MRRYLSLLSLFILIAVLIPLTIQAQTVTIDNPLGPGATFWSLVDKIINFIFTLAIPISAIMIIVAGYRFVTAMGDPAKITTAKQMILWTLIGLLVIISAKGIIALFGQIFGINTGLSGGGTGTGSTNNNPTLNILQILNPGNWFGQ